MQTASRSDPARGGTALHPSGTARSDLALSLGVAAGEFVFVSGAVAFHPETGEIVGRGVEEQTRQTLHNIEAVLAEADLGFVDVVQARIYLSDIRRDFRSFDAVYREFLSAPFPARTTVGVELAVPGLLVEIDAVARRRA
ncbi:RidA family protein [Occultella gossypii]|uniref:RidA family protein n=1 Tax=Occultella gossypii TaxID=2800820 RepID=A0ABS7S8Z3_9MICO|nr:RidA family protein [Occultella gossypii]MBZ2196819.1 RidA family protein [Occultella gossypii]